MVVARGAGHKVVVMMVVVARGAGHKVVVRMLLTCLLCIRCVADLPPLHQGPVEEMLRTAEKLLSSVMLICSLWWR